MHSVIFDCDGVLVDSEHLSCGAWLPVLARYGVRAELSEIEAMIGKSDQSVLNHFASKTGAQFSDGKYPTGCIFMPPPRPAADKPA